LTRQASSFARKAKPQNAPAQKTQKASGAAQNTVTIEELRQMIEQSRMQANAQKLDSRSESASTDFDGDRPSQIRYFDEEQPGQYRRLRDDTEFSEASSGLDAEVIASINELEQQMEATVQMLEQLEKDGEPAKAEELRKFFTKTLKTQYNGWTPTGYEEFVDLPRISGFKGPRYKAVANLNTFLGRNSLAKGEELKQKELKECWKLYSAARKTLSTAWENVPPQVWKFLWTLAAWEGDGIENPNRMRHVYVIAKDMQAAGMALTEAQQLLIIEAMFIEGWQAEAMDAWKKAVVTIGSQPDLKKDYWELGVRMCCVLGDTDRALRAAEALLESVKDVNVRILIPVIRAMAAKETTVKQAMETYQMMREHLGDDMKIEDYDEVIASFLAGGYVEYALQIFVDMMFAGTVDIRGKTKLPTQVGNHFFLGKWLKRLIGAGDLDGAYKVVSYVQKQGITPSPIQLNGLIGAWLRSETTENMEKAEKLAWEMISARIAYVHLRRRGASMDQPTKLYGPLADREETEEFYCTTRATAETFGLMAEDYRLRGLHSRAVELWEAFELAEIGTSSFIVNQLIKSYTQDNQAEEAIEFYQRMALERGFKPDAHTFLALFGTLSVNRLISRDPELAQKDVATSREFFADMMRSKWVFDSLDTYNYLPRTILFTMLKTKDFAGLIVAARAMKLLFNFTPPESLLIELATGTVTLRVQTKGNMRRIMEGCQTVEMLLKQHRASLEREGVDVMNMTAEQRDEELLAVLEQLALHKRGLRDVDPKTIWPMLVEAAKEMGMYEVVFELDEKLITKYRKVTPKKPGDIEQGGASE